MTTIYDFYKTILSKDYYYTPYETWYDFQRDINKQRNDSSGIELFCDNDCKVDYICVYFVQD